MADEEEFMDQKSDSGDDQDIDDYDVDSSETPSTRRRGRSGPVKRNPTRNRKPNPRIFGDPEDPLFTSYPAYKRKSKLKDEKNILIKETRGSNSKYVANHNASRLRNLLKLPKASRWVYCEFFYSTLDHSLFKGENDFFICMQECFPSLNLGRLTRPQWVIMRRILGKPRRCSPAFFDEERSALHQRRQKVRLLQNTKLKDIDHLNDMPPNIPMSLVVGSRVTSRLRSPYDGIYTGTIEALDTVTHSYRITFDRPGIGTYSVPDYEILHDCSHDSLPITSFTLKVHRDRGTPQHFGKSLLSPSNYLEDSPLGATNPDNDPFIGQSTISDFLKKESDEMTMDCQSSLSLPQDLIDKLNEFAKLIDTKQKVLTKYRSIIRELSDGNYQLLNDSGIMMKKNQCLYELEVLNSQMFPLMFGIDKLLFEKLPDNVKDSAKQILFHQERYMEEADKIYEKIRGDSLAPKVSSKFPQIVELIKRMSSIQMQMSAFRGRKAQAVEIAALQESLEASKLMLDPTNRVIFETEIEKYVEKTLGIASPEPRKRLIKH